MNAGELKTVLNHLAPETPVKIVLRSEDDRAVPEQPIKELTVRFDTDGRPVLTIEA